MRAPFGPRSRPRPSSWRQKASRGVAIRAKSSDPGSAGPPRRVGSTLPVNHPRRVPAPVYPIWRTSNSGRLWSSPDCPPASPRVGPTMFFKAGCHGDFLTTTTPRF
jgi:hypothetical protein